MLSHSHHWQCSWSCDPTEAEVAAWRAAMADEDELGAAHEPLEDPETPDA